MGQYGDRAEQLFKEGYNCSQSVYAAAAEAEGADIEAALKISSSFGGGMGRLREVCGALTGLFMAAGSRYGYIDPNDQAAKAEHYQLVQDLARQFRERYGTILCRDLLELQEQNSDPVPEARTDQYYRERPCAAYVRYCAELLETLDQERQAKR